MVKMYKVPVRFVSDAKGPLEAKPGRVVVTIADSSEHAADNALALFREVIAAGVDVEIGYAAQLSDTYALESFVFAFVYSDS